MGISRPCYTSREDVKAALDVKQTARTDGQVDRAIESASDSIDGGVDRIGGLLKRRFYPERRVMTFDWPDRNRSWSWRLWLNQHEIISVESITSGDLTLNAGEYFLRPDDGPPFTHVEIDLGGPGSFQSGDSHQRSVAITGLYGFSSITAPAGTLTAGVDAVQTSVPVSDSAAVGVGDVVLTGGERMLVTDKAMVDTGQDLAADLAVSTAAVAVAVSDGAAFGVGETILLDAERMLIVDIAGNTLIVKRGWDGSVLAAHTTGADVYAPRTLTVTRGALGTTAAAHSSGAGVSRQVWPALVQELATAEALNTLLQRQSGYARTVGSGEGEREATGAGLAAIRELAYAAYGRKARKRAV
ncbi:hypothetical protein [Actinomadura sp. 21ATH]|uniref:hypothetical protein n=1 Tax=Actinomadura sp. 21ATH TaxID=1735444 RepID=UPI0035BFB08B